MGNTKEEIMASRQQSTQSTPNADVMAAFRSRQMGGMGRVASALVNQGQQSTAQNTGTQVTQNADVPVTPQPTAPQPTFTSYADMYNAMKKDNEEQRKIDDKKQKRDQMFAAIGDGISALSNLYFTSKGAPNAFNPNQTMSDRTREMYDKINKDREERYQQNLNMAISMADKDNAQKRYLDEFAYKQGRDKIADENAAKDRAEREAARNQQQQNWQQQFDYNKEKGDQQQQNFEAQFAEQQRQNREANAIRRQQAAREAKAQYAREITLGNGKTARIAHSRFNPSNIGYVFDALPDGVKDKYLYEDVLDKYKKPVYDYKRDENGQIVKDANGKPVKEKVRRQKQLTNDQMLHVIGQYVGSDQKVADAWREVGGEIDETSNNGSKGGNTDWSSYEKGKSGQKSGGKTDWSQYQK